jgi:hypothetical protein
VCFCLRLTARWTLRGCSILVTAALSCPSSSYLTAVLSSFGVSAGSCPSAVNASLAGNSTCALACQAHSSRLPSPAPTGQVSCRLGLPTITLPTCVADCQMPAALPVGLLPGSCTLNGWMVDVNASATASTCTLDLLDGYLMPDNVPSALQITCRNGTILLPIEPLAPCNGSTLVSLMSANADGTAVISACTSPGVVLTSAQTCQSVCTAGYGNISTTALEGLWTCRDGNWTGVPLRCRGQCDGPAHTPSSALLSCCWY